MTDATRYPLSWPAGWKRTPARDRKPTTFGEKKSDNGYSRTVPVTFVTARYRLWQQLELLGVHSDKSILSTNQQLNSMGHPRADRRAPEDVGVAIYFQIKGKDRVLACDKWDTVAGNMAALANHIDAIRRVDRYGVGTLDQAFAGYDALPPPGATAKIPWRKVFEYADDARPSKVDLQARYRTMAARFHPDLQGGSHEAMAMLNTARDEALKEIG